MVTEIHWYGLATSPILIPLFITAVLAAFFNRIQLKKLILRLSHQKHRKVLVKRWSTTRSVFKLFFLSLAFLSLLLALLRPQWGKKEQIFTHEGRDILVALDISRSMLAKDLSPNRLEFTKLKLQNLLGSLGPDRVALILFSGSAFVQCPFTADFSAFKMFLNQVDTQSISSGSTAIDKALTKAMDLFKRCPSRKHKILLLITDGEDFSLNFDETIKKAQNYGINILILGVGTTNGAPIPKLGFDGKPIGHETNEDGSVALSKLNEPLLRKMAQSLNGSYFLASYDDSDIMQIISQIEGFEKEKIEDRKVALYEDKYPWLAGLSALLFGIEWLL